MGGSVGLIIGSLDGGFGDDFFFEWVCFGGVALVLVLISVFSSTLFHSLTRCWLKQGPMKAWQLWRLLIGDGVSHDGDGVFLGIFDSLGFKLATWVSDRWLGFANRWLGWWVWWPLLALTGLMVCVCVALLMVCVCVCVALLMV